MKAITVQQPWAWAITAGHKLVENRTWSKPYRGPLAIHAGKTWDDDGESTFLRLMAEIEVLPPKWYREPGTLPAGFVVAVAELVDVCDMDRRIRNGPGLVGEQYLHRSMLPLDQAPIDHIQPKEYEQADMFDLIAELEDGDPDGCSPFGCRSGGAA